MAQLSGLVTDPTDAVIAGSSITARNRGNGQVRITQTSGEGEYLLANLPPGFYEVTVEAPGFTRLQQTGIELTVGQTATLNFSLRVAGPGESVTVAANAALLESARTEQSQVVEERRIRNLPINGRHFLDFILLTPHADTGRSSVNNQARSGEPNQIDISFAGLEEIASLITVDGADNTNRIWGRPRSAPSQEAVREFRVVTNGYGADLGPAAGAVANIVTESGTNSLRGTIYSYVRDDALDARHLLAPPTFDELRQNQFGATLGGPFRRNRMFFFGNYEGQRRDESPFYSSVLLNNLPAINAVKQSLGLRPEVLEGKLRESDYDSFTVRSDYQAWSKHVLGAIYRFRRDRATNLGAATGQLSAPSHFRDSRIHDQAFVANLTSNLSAMSTNSAMFQFARRTFDFLSVTYEPNLQIPNTLDMGRAFNAPDATEETRFEIGSALTYTRGAHSTKFGGSAYHVRSQLLLDGLDPGTALFPNMDAFLGNPPFPPFPFAAVFYFNVGPDGSRPPAPRNFIGPANFPAFASVLTNKTRVSHYAVFSQDHWRVRPNLTVNGGLRWDVDNLPSEGYDRYYGAFQPRLAFAYSLSDRIVLRASAGVYQGIKDLSEYLISRVYRHDAQFGLVNPEYSTASGGMRAVDISNPAVAAPAFLEFVRTGTYPSAQQPGQLPGAHIFLSVHRTNPRGLYTYQWNTQLEFQIAPDMAASLGYIGVRGLNLSSGGALNLAPAALRLPNGKNDYAIAPDVPVARVFNPRVSSLALFFDDTAQSNYHGGSVSLIKRFSRYHSFTANYTWSKAIDNSGSLAVSDFPEDTYRRDLERARSKQDVPHRFVASLTAEGPAQTWLRNFRLSFIQTLASARYYTVFAGFDANHDGNPLTDRVETLGRNTFKGDKLVNLDLRLSRVVRLSERVSTEVIAEAFNLFNTLNVTEVNTVYGAPQLIGPEPRQFDHSNVTPLSSFGSIRAIAPPRQIQFAFRLTF